MLGWQTHVEVAVVYQQLVEAFVRDGGLSQLSTAHLSQLLQAHLASQFLGLGLITLPSSMLQVAVQAYRDKAQRVTVSKSQRQVGESLRRLRIYTTRARVHHGGWAIQHRSSGRGPAHCDRGR
jgi:hypothetical protein